MFKKFKCKVRPNSSGCGDGGGRPRITRDGSTGRKKQGSLYVGTATTDTKSKVGWFEQRRQKKWKRNAPKRRRQLAEMEHKAKVEEAKAKIRKHKNTGRSKSNSGGWRAIIGSTSTTSRASTRPRRRRRKKKQSDGWAF